MIAKFKSFKTWTIPWHNLFKLNADGSSTGLTAAVSVDLLADSYVSTVEASHLLAPLQFHTKQFLAHAQTRINAALNDYAVDVSTDAIDGASSLGVSNQLFGRAVGSKMDAILTATQIVNLKHATSMHRRLLPLQQVLLIDLWSIPIRAMTKLECLRQQDPELTQLGHYFI